MSARLAIVGILALAALVSGCGKSDIHVRAEFEDAAGLRPGSQVKVGGVVVGEVSSLKVTRRDTAVAGLDLDDSIGGVGRNARASIRPADLLGEKFVELRPGDRARPLRGGSTIPVARTDASVELADLLAVLDKDTRVRLAVILRESGIAVSGNGANLAETLRSLPRGLDDVAALAAQLTADNRALDGLLVRSDRLVNDVSARRQSLGELVETGSEALTTFERRRDELGATLEVAPGTLSQLRATLARLDQAGDALVPAADGLRRTAGPLDSALRALPRFADDARPLLRTATKVAPLLRALGIRATPVARELRSATTILQGLAHDSHELTRYLDLGAADLLGVAEGWARALQPRDAAGHLFRIQMSLDPQIVKALIAYVGNPDQQSQVREAPARPRRPKAPVPRAHPEVRRGGSTAPPAPAAPPPGGAGPAPAGPAPLGRPGTGPVQPLLDFLLGP